jgi:arylsulfatase A-like enzyme
MLNDQSPSSIRTIAFIQGDTNDNAIAIRSGKWKLIESTDNQKQKLHNLYDLSIDQGETNDVAKNHPEIVKKLATALDETREDGRTRL